MSTVLEPSRTISSAAWLSPPKSARLAVALCFFLNGVLVATWVSRIPAVQARLGLTHGALGFALLCMGLGAVVAMPLAGWCSSRFGSDRVTQFTAMVTCALLPLLAFAPNALFLMLVLAAFGAVHGGFDVAMNAQAVAVEERYARPIMSSFHALWSVGGLVGAALGGLIAGAGVLPLTHFSVTSILLGVSACAVILPRLLPVGSSAFMEMRSEEDVGGTRFAALRSGKLLALGAIAFCVMMGEGAMADWSAIFLREAAGASESIAAAGYAAFSLAMAFGRFSGDQLTSRLGSTTLLRLSGALAAVGLSIALLFPQSSIALIGFAAVGLGFATVVPIVFSAAGRLPSLNPGTALATATTLGYSGFLIGPPCIGFIAQSLGLRTALTVIVFTTALIIVLAHHTRPGATAGSGNCQRPLRRNGHVFEDSELQPWKLAPLLP